jgi:hypothetical protein
VRTVNATPVVDVATAAALAGAERALDDIEAEMGASKAPRRQSM